MNDKFYSNKEFTDIKKRINAEIKRRGGFSWLDPLSTPKVGQDRTPNKAVGFDTPVPVDDLTYTINNPSEGALEPTRNIHYPSIGENPAGTEPKFVSAEPNTSAALFTVDELKNFITGLSKISDIDKFYGRDEEAGLAFRDPNAIDEILTRAEGDKLHERATSLIKEDPNGYVRGAKASDYPVAKRSVKFPTQDGYAVLPSGEYDGDELEKYDDLGPNNFFDDYGAPEGDGDFHPYNRATTPIVHRDIVEQTDDRKAKRTVVIQGGRKASDFGPNPRNPEVGDEYSPYPAFTGAATSCNNVCTGLCNVSCDDICSESCTVTCTMRCGNACTSTCGNVCTGCSSMCYNTCKTKCENSTGYACVKSGAKAVKVTDDGIQVETVSCTGCSYSCQFYPNKKTTCWDAGCMGECFTSCESGCMNSCVGSCMGTEGESGSACSGSCTADCIGKCEGVCSGECVTTCFSSCEQQCSDNCEYTCMTDCGHGCATSCMQKCLGCSSTCDGSCTGGTDSKSCAGCGYRGGCTSTCANSCEDSCFNQGCKSMCGINDTNACDTNCRMNCSGSSCTALCEDACTFHCTSCANTCGFACGESCESACSNSCEYKCSRMCTETCKNNCSNNCVQSCTEECGGCSALCYSCVGMCIGVCSVKCESGCSSCENNCSFWCDTQCNQACFSNCSSFCLSSCSASCSTRVDTEAKKEERESIKIIYRDED